MELRAPRGLPGNAAGSEAAGGAILWSGARFLGIVVVAEAVAIVVLAVLLVLLRAPRSTGSSDEDLRRLATKLRSAGALGESALLLEQALEASDLDPESRARLAYTAGQTWLEHGDTERALRWFYEAEGLEPGALREELGRKIVNCLERLGRPHAAQAALDERTRLEGASPAAEPSGEHSADDPIVARIADQEIRRSEVLRALDELPGVAAALDAQQRQAFLGQFVAEEMLWRKAQKLEYDRDPQVVRNAERARKQLAVARFVEREVVDKLVIDPADLHTYFTAHRERYAAGAGQPEPAFEDVRAQVERDYVQSKVQSAYQEMLDSELKAAGVELFPEKLIDG